MRWCQPGSPRSVFVQFGLATFHEQGLGWFLPCLCSLLSNVLTYYLHLHKNLALYSVYLEALKYLLILFSLVIRFCPKNSWPTRGELQGICYFQIKNLCTVGLTKLVHHLIECFIAINTIVLKMTEKRGEGLVMKIIGNFLLLLLCKVYMYMGKELPVVTKHEIFFLQSFLHYFVNKKGGRRQAGCS